MMAYRVFARALRLFGIQELHFTVKLIRQEKSGERGPFPWGEFLKVMVYLFLVWFLVGQMLFGPFLSASSSPAKEDNVPILASPRG